MQNRSSVGICTHCIHVSARLAPICMLSRCLLTTFLHPCSVKSALLVGEKIEGGGGGCRAPPPPPKQKSGASVRSRGGGFFSLFFFFFLADTSSSFPYPANQPHRWDEKGGSFSFLPLPYGRPLPPPPPPPPTTRFVMGGGGGRKKEEEVAYFFTASLSLFAPKVLPNFHPRGKERKREKKIANVVPRILPTYLVVTSRQTCGRGGNRC